MGHRDQVAALAVVLAAGQAELKAASAQGAPALAVARGAVVLEVREVQVAPGVRTTGAVREIHKAAAVLRAGAAVS